MMANQVKNYSKGITAFALKINDFQRLTERSILNYIEK
jgi:hypothetical protein